MNGHRLTLRQRLPLRLDLRGVLPGALAALDLAAVERLPVAHGREWLPLAECFHIEAFETEAPRLHFIGDLSRVDHLGWGLDGGDIRVDGPVGDHLGSTMRAGTLRVRGSAARRAGIEAVIAAPRSARSRRPRGSAHPGPRPTSPRPTPRRALAR